MAPTPQDLLMPDMRRERFGMVLIHPGLQTDVTRMEKSGPVHTLQARPMPDMRMEKFGTALTLQAHQTDDMKMERFGLALTLQAHQMGGMKALTLAQPLLLG